MEKRKSKLPYLLDDLITEILLRSSVKSVGRFRCLSKMFYSMLSDPNFARKQIELTLRRHSNNRRLIMSSSWQKLLLVDLDSMDVEHEYSSKEDLIFVSQRTSIIGSSNGLVCYRCVRDKEDEILLYNPTIRDSKIIPKLPESMYRKPHHQWPSWYTLWIGFGFDALSNDYKVVKLISCREINGHKYTVCYVYSLKTDSWRRINNLLPYYTYVNISSENLKGAMHWIAGTEGGEDQKMLMAFDLEKEEMREMTLPDWADQEFVNVGYYAVDTLKGCLCVVHRIFKMHNVIWVMKEYGLESSWCKIRINVSEFSIKPTLCLTNNDEDSLLVLDNHFVYTKFKTDGGKFFFYTKIRTGMYVESLVSPSSYMLNNRDE